MKHAHLLLAIVAMLALAACSGKSSVADDIATAELAYAGEDVDGTRHICRSLIGDSGKNIDVRQYGRLSILFMQLNERDDNQEDLALAAQCYEEAYRLNPDSARYFYSHLPVEQDKYVMLLSNLVKTRSDRENGTLMVDDDSLSQCDGEDYCTEPHEHTQQ